MGYVTPAIKQLKIFTLHMSMFYGRNCPRHIHSCVSVTTEKSRRGFCLVVASTKVFARHGAWEEHAARPWSGDGH